MRLLQLLSVCAAPHLHQTALVWDLPTASTQCPSCVCSTLSQTYTRQASHTWQAPGLPLGQHCLRATRCFVSLSAPSAFISSIIQRVMKSQTKLYRIHLSPPSPSLVSFHSQGSGILLLSNNLTEPHASQWDAAPIGSNRRGHSILFTSVPLPIRAPLPAGGGLAAEVATNPVTPPVSSVLLRQTHIHTLTDGHTAGS